METLAPYAAQHATLAGPGDARPTALQIIKDQELVGKLGGKVALITGCSSGLGVETARAMHATGADVYMTVRDMAKGEEVAQEIRADGGSGRVELIQLSLDDFASVRAGAAAFLAKSQQLHILINNAAVMACPEGTTKDGFETQFGTNHLGHFLLFQLLKPTLLASASPSFPSRVVSLSSAAHRDGTLHFDDLALQQRGYSPFVAYNQAKLANIYFANELDRRYGPHNLHAWSVHPGGIATPLLRHLPSHALTGMMKTSPELAAYMKNPEQGAATAVWATVAAELKGHGGRYLENCSVAERQSGSSAWHSGFAGHAYDEQAERRLWLESLKMVGIEDE